MRPAIVASGAILSILLTSGEVIGQDRLTVTALSSASWIMSPIGRHTAAGIGGEFRVEYAPSRFGFGAGVDLARTDVDSFVGGNDMGSLAVFGFVTRRFGSPVGVQPYLQGRIGWKRLFADDTPYLKNAVLPPLVLVFPTGEFDQSGFEFGLAGGLQIPLTGRFALETSGLLTILSMSTARVADTPEPTLADDAVRLGLRVGLTVGL